MKQQNFIFPNYKECNMNISATLAEFLGAPNKNATLPLLEAELKKGYKNVVFICFDGLGNHPLEVNLEPDNILRRNIKQTLLSTFPSTTTNATTSLLTNTLPLEHGWLGWCLYIPKLDKVVDIFTNEDSATEEPVDMSDSPLEKPKYYFDNANTDYNISTVFPPYVKVKNELNNNIFTMEDEFFDIVKEISERDGKQFVYAYYPDPDSTMHMCGVSSPEAKQVIESISNNIEKLSNEVKDTLFIITADHGQVDVSDHILIYEDKELMDTLLCPPYLEARAPAFKVKKGREKDFEKAFEKYAEDFVLFKTKDLVEKGFFGDRGDKAHLLGDYVAVSTFSHKQLVLFEGKRKFKGHHTSLTEEMLVPLILIPCKK